MNIQPIVEGHGEVAALPVLLRRLRDETWRGRYVDSKDKTKCVTLFDNKELSKSKFEAITHRVREELAGIRKPDQFEEHRETPLVCSKCKGSGCSDAKGKAIDCEPNHLSGFQEHLEAKGNSTDSVKLIVARVRIVSEANGFRELSDLSVGQVAAPGRTRFQLHRKLHSIRCNLGILRRCQSVQRQR